MKLNLFYTADKVKRYPYRTAEVVNRIIVCQYDEKDTIWFFQKCLSEWSNNRTPDNHECYEVLYENGKKVYFQFSDWKMYVGLGIVEKR